MTNSHHQQQEIVEKSLQNPGPNVVIIDEAHLNLKNELTKTYTSLLQIQTRFRIALTGTPVQNNLKEYVVPQRWGMQARANA